MHAPRNHFRPRPRRVSIFALLFAGACAPPATEQVTDEPVEIVIRGHDYAFELEQPVPAGTVRFAFENVGEVPHEAILVALKEGVTPDQVAVALQDEDDPRELMSGIFGILIADPGESALGKIVVELETGRTYALLCNFTDTDDAPPHIALGMMRVFQAT